MDIEYARVAAHVLSRPWAVTPEMMATMADLLALRMQGGRLDRDEIAARINAAKPQPVGKVRAGAAAVVPIHGVITHRADMFSEISGMTSLEKVRAQLDAALQDKKVETVMLHIDSPGGSVDGVTETAAMVREARGKKRVVAVADTLAASAAYWIGSQADEFTITPSGEVGSIGVYTMHRDLSRRLGNDGVNVSLIHAGAHKVEGNPFEPLSSEARAAIQGDVDEVYDMFVADVAAGRGVTLDTVLGTYGQGRTLSAKRALAAGMVDVVEPFAETLARYRGTAPAEDPPSAPIKIRRGQAARTPNNRARLSAGLLLSSLPPARG